jgi:putative ribosome biogenesis GTPase RsgA
LNEPGCAVIEAVNKNLIPESRYNSYLGMLENQM